jgi:hypothetical protein
MVGILGVGSKPESTTSGVFLGFFLGILSGALEVDPAEVFGAAFRTNPFPPSSVGHVYSQKCVRETCPGGVEGRGRSAARRSGGQMLAWSVDVRCRTHHSNDTP